MGRGDGGEEVAGGLKTRAGNRRGGPRVVDRNDKRIIESLPDAPIYKKHVQIKARPATLGEKIDTILPDGRVETTNTADEGDWIVTNPSGEEYIVGGDTFAKKYEETEQEGVFQAKGQIRAISNPWAADISLEASWGELQHGDQECMVVASCDAKGNIEGQPYIVDKAAFKETYVPAEGASALGARQSAAALASDKKHESVYDVCENDVEKAALAFLYEHCDPDKSSYDWDNQFSITAVFNYLSQNNPDLNLRHQDVTVALNNLALRKAVTQSSRASNGGEFHFSVDSTPDDHSAAVALALEKKYESVRDVCENDVEKAALAFIYEHHNTDKNDHDRDNQFSITAVFNYLSQNNPDLNLRHQDVTMALNNLALRKAVTKSSRASEFHFSV